MNDASDQQLLLQAGGPPKIVRFLGVKRPATLTQSLGLERVGFELHERGIDQPTDGE